MRNLLLREIQKKTHISKIIQFLCSNEGSLEVLIVLAFEKSSLVCVCVCYINSSDLCTAWSLRLSCCSNLSQSLNKMQHTHTHTVQRITSKSPTQIHDFSSTHRLKHCSGHSADTGDQLQVRNQLHHRQNLSLPFSHLSRSNVTPPRARRHVAGWEHMLYFNMCVGEGSVRGRGAEELQLLQKTLAETLACLLDIHHDKQNKMAAVEWAVDDPCTREESGRRQAINLQHKVREDWRPAHVAAGHAIVGRVPSTVVTDGYSMGLQDFMVWISKCAQICCPRNSWTSC